MKSFEVIDSLGEKHWYDGDFFIWQFGLKSGTQDVDDRSFIEIVTVEDSDVVYIYLNPVAVGDCE